MENVSYLVQTGFALTTFATVGLFFKATQNKKILYFLLLYMSITAFLGISGFFRVTDTTPPRFLLFGLGFVLTIIFAFTPKGNTLIQHINNKWLVMLHIVRIPVEIVLYTICIAGLIPPLMTFEGYNFDILSGISAPIIFYLYFVKSHLSKKGLLIWNMICLALLVNIVTLSILSAPTPFQVLAFQQPNIGMTYFPFIWLPTIVVPIVLFSHIAQIKQLLKPGNWHEPI